MAGKRARRESPQPASASLESGNTSSIIYSQLSQRPAKPPGAAVGGTDVKSSSQYLLKKLKTFGNVQTLNFTAGQGSRGIQVRLFRWREGDYIAALVFNILIWFALYSLLSLSKTCGRWRFLSESGSKSRSTGGPRTMLRMSISSASPWHPSAETIFSGHSAQACRLDSYRLDELSTNVRYIAISD